jgi:hypothetical protein
MILFIVLGSAVIVAIAATIRDIPRDGYRRTRDR